MKKSIPKVWERESEASILGNDREREFPLTPALLPAANPQHHHHCHHRRRHRRHHRHHRRPLHCITYSFCPQVLILNLCTISSCIIDLRPCH